MQTKTDLTLLTAVFFKKLPLVAALSPRTWPWKVVIIGSWSVEWEELWEEEPPSGCQLARPKPWTVASSELCLPIRKGSSVLHFCTLLPNWNHSTIFQVPKDYQSSAIYGGTCLVSEKFKRVQITFNFNQFFVNICHRRIFFWETLSNGFEKIWTIRSFG